MFHKFLSTFFSQSSLKWVIALLALLSLGILSGVVASPAAQETEQVEPDAGTWQTWVLESGDQFRLDAPPDEAATADEIAQLIEMAGQRDDAALQQIAYWNAGPPAYRWNQIAMNAMLAQAMPGNIAYRDLALLNAAIYDATVAAWDSKYAHNRPRPSEVDPALETVIPNPASPSYPSEYAVTAGAASAVLGWLFPDQAQTYADLAQEAVNSRLLAGVEYPSDVEAGLALGQQVAELVIARGQADGSDAQWTGSVPTEPGHWTGENPIFPMAGTWDTWVLESGDQFRPAPPPAYDSEQLAAEMDELRNFERTPVTNSIAQFWEFGSGGRRAHWFWNDQLTRLLLASDWADNAPRAARAYALMNMAGNDSGVACWDAKYAYWAIRPFQLDPEFTSLFTTPNHPAYPSAHSCLSTATADVLAYLFPADAADMQALAQQATESRIWAGIHFRSDVESGIALGEDVAGAVVEHAMSDGSQ
jgi:membrane-associated phospholipid phosphatase